MPRDSLPCSVMGLLDGKSKSIICYEGNRSDAGVVILLTGSGAVDGAVDGMHESTES